jgi:hypothetical protein
MHFLEMKRSTYGRFCFMSDAEFIQVLEHVKDARSTSAYVHYCFNTEKLQLDGELMAAFEHSSEVFKTQPD